MYYHHHYYYYYYYYYYYGYHMFSSLSLLFSFYNPPSFFFCVFFLWNWITGYRLFVPPLDFCWHPKVTASVTRSHRMLSSKNAWWKIPIPRTTKMMMSQWARSFLLLFAALERCFSRGKMMEPMVKGRFRGKIMFFLMGFSGFDT